MQMLQELNMVVKVKQSQQHTDNWTDECRLWLVSVWAGLDCDIAGFGWSVCGPGLIVTLQALDGQCVGRA